MTIEAVFAKLSYLLGKGYSNNEVKRLMTVDMRGEITIGGNSCNLDSHPEETKTEEEIETDYLLGSTYEAHNPIAEQKRIKETVITYNHLRDLNHIVDLGIDINSKDKDGKTPLHNAVLEGDEDLVSHLCNQKGIDPNILDDEGNSPLFYACKKGNKSMVQTITFEGGKLITSKDTLISTLFAKTKKGHIGTIRLFEKVGADITIQDSEGDNLAHVAAKDDQQIALSYLAQSTQIDFETKNNKQQTAFDLINQPAVKEAIKKLVSERN